MDSNEFQNKLKAVGLSVVADELIDSVYICSVAGGRCNANLNWLAERLWQCKAIFFRTQRETAGVLNSYVDPSKMGADRWLASVYAVNRFPKRSVCVIDCGSAINIEMLGAEGKHLGGYIIPGIAMMQNALLKNTAEVNASLEKLELAPGQETGANVANGSLLAAVAIIEKMVDRQKKLQGVVLLTGGDAEIIAPYLTDIDVQCLPDLVLDGFAYWRQYQASDANTRN